MAGRPLFYGWIVVAIAFVTMAVAISARTGYSLLLPEIIAEFGWSSSLSAGAFAAGFIFSTLFLPVVGWSMARFGPRVTLPAGGALVALGYLSATWVSAPAGLYFSFGLLVVSGSMAMSYISHALFLSKWFARNRGLAVGVAYSGVGVGGLLLLPAMQAVIDAAGWRAACLAAAAVIACVIIPLNAIFQRAHPGEMGLLPDGDPAPVAGEASPHADRVADRAWAARDWTLRAAMETRRFWSLFFAFFCALFVWYAIQVHQTRFLIGLGHAPSVAALALGVSAALGIVGQIGLGALSDRWGREPVWTLAMGGFGLTALALLGLDAGGPGWLIWVAAAATGLLATGMAPLFGAVPADLFAGRRYAAIFTALSFGGNIGAGLGVWAMGAIHDATGGYGAGFRLCLVVAMIGAILMWSAGPGRVRLAAGRARRRAEAEL